LKKTEKGLKGDFGQGGVGSWGVKATTPPPPPETYRGIRSCGEGLQSEKTAWERRKSKKEKNGAK